MYLTKNEYNENEQYSKKKRPVVYSPNKTHFHSRSFGCLVCVRVLIWCRIFFLVINLKSYFQND